MLPKFWNRFTKFLIGGWKKIKLGDNYFVLQSSVLGKTMFVHQGRSFFFWKIIAVFFHKQPVYKQLVLDRLSLKE